MQIKDLPKKPPLTCRLHLHKWSGWYPTPIHHLGEYDWETWQHICLARVKSCVRCGHTRAGLFHQVEAYGGWSVRLKKQPYKPTREEIERASKALMADFER